MSHPDIVVSFPAKADAPKKASSTELIWGKAVMTHGYTAVPAIMVRAQSRLGINATQFNILVQLLEHWRNPERRPFPTKKEIAGRIGLTAKTVQLNIRALEKAGLVWREQRKTATGDWGSNVYHLDGLIDRVRKMEPEFSEEKRKRADERRKVETPKGLRGIQP
jgi:predicted transcriptional regulator